MTLIRKNFYITTDQENFLSSREELTISEHIRRAIDQYIEKLKSYNVSVSESTRKEGE